MLKKIAVRYRGFFWAMAFVVALSACSSSEEVRTEGDDAFADPDGGGLAAADTLPSDTQGAGDLGLPASELQMVFFPFDSAVISPEAIAALKDNAKYLKENPAVKVQIEGHCDERGTVEYNLALGERRAKASRDRLKKLGVPQSRMSTISYGKERPLDPGHDESAWSKNRRSAFVVVGP